MSLYRCVSEKSFLNPTGDMKLVMHVCDLARSEPLPSYSHSLPHLYFGKSASMPLEVLHLGSQSQGPPLLQTGRGHMITLSVFLSI